MEDNNTYGNIQPEEDPTVDQISDRIIGSLEEGLFDCVREYVAFLKQQASDKAIMTMALEISLYFMVLDPYIKKRLVEFMEEWIMLLRGGTFDKLLVGEEFEERVSELIKRGKDTTEFNEYALRKLIGYLSMDTAMYRDSKR